MQVFEFHFNPKARENTVFDSFIYEPENISEKRLGYLYMAGQILNAYPQDSKFLEDLAGVIKDEYYCDFQRTSESALREALRKANEFLSRAAKKGEVNWLGNLNFAVLSIREGNLPPVPISADFSFILNFAQVGQIKILLLKGQNILDISQKLEKELKSEPYPLKIFENTISGKLSGGDRIMIFTKDVFAYFEDKNLIDGFLRVTNEKSLNEILKSKKKELSGVSGILLFIPLAGEGKKTAGMSFKKPLARGIKSLPLKLKIKPPSLHLPALHLPKIHFPKLPGFHFPSFHLKLPKPRLGLPRGGDFPSPPGLAPKFSGAKKKIVPALILIFVLALAFFIFKGEREKEVQKTAQILEGVKIEKIQAENFLILGEADKANFYFQSAWSKILALDEEKTPAKLKSEIWELRKLIEGNLISLNKLEKISEPELILEIPSQEIKLLPQNILVFRDSLYFFNPFSANIYKFDPEAKKGEILGIRGNIKLGAPILDSIGFFLEPDLFVVLKNNEFKEYKLISPLPEFNFNLAAGFIFNVYFLDRKSGQIVKYDISPEKYEILGNRWLSPETKKSPVGGKSMTIDGNIWIVLNENEIERYYQGEYQETISVNIFPFLENPTKIWTKFDLPRLYILEPKNNRIIIIDKKGRILKQYQSEKFNNLLDFAVTEDGKTIYLLNGLNIYRLSP